MPSPSLELRREQSRRTSRRHNERKKVANVLKMVPVTSADPERDAARILAKTLRRAADDVEGHDAHVLQSRLQTAKLARELLTGYEDRRDELNRRKVADLKPIIEGVVAIVGQSVLLAKQAEVVRQLEALIPEDLARELAKLDG